MLDTAVLSIAVGSMPKNWKKLIRVAGSTLQLPHPEPIIMAAPLGTVDLSWSNGRTSAAMTIDRLTMGRHTIKTKVGHGQKRAPHISEATIFIRASQLALFDATIFPLGLMLAKSAYGCKRVE
jgi:hypothetical protein